MFKDGSRQIDENEEKSKIEQANKKYAFKFTALLIIININFRYRLFILFCEF